VDDLEAMCRALAAAEGLDPDELMIPRKPGQEVFKRMPLGWSIPKSETFVPAWHLFRGLAEAALAERREHP